MITSILLGATVVVNGFYFGALTWTVFRRSSGPAPWPFRLVVDEKGTPRLGYLWLMLSMAILLVAYGAVSFANLPPSPRQQQLDRIEQLLRELDKKVP